MKYFALASLLLIASLSEGKIQVLYPLSLKSHFTTLASEGQAVIPSSLGSFGHIQYGVSMMGSVHYPLTNQDGCREFLGTDFSQEELEDEDTGLPPIIMVDRGNCTFVEKTLNLEKMGASFVLIADNQAYEQAQSVFMIDDGRGRDLRVPAFLISKVDSQLIKNTLANGTHIRLKAVIEISNPANKVQMELYYQSSFDFLDFDFEGFAKINQILNQEQAPFIPRLVTYSCRHCFQTFKEQYCISDGAYCMYEPQQDVNDEEEASYRGMMEVSLRERCLFINQYEKNITYWYMYLKQYVSECLHSEGKNLSYKHATPECSKRIIARDGIALESEVDQCVQGSFNETGNWESHNWLLETDRRQHYYLGIQLHPSLVINNYTYRGDLLGRDVFYAVCSGFKTKPRACNQKQFDKKLPSNVITVVTPSGQPIESQAKNSHVIMAILLVVLINIGCLCAFRLVHKRRQSAVMKHQVNQAVSKYFQIASNDYDQVRSSSVSQNEESIRARTIGGVSLDAI